MAGWIVYDTPKALAVASESRHFRDAIQALSVGDLASAEKALFGSGEAYGSNSFFQELVDKVDPNYALLFQDKYYKMLNKVDRQLDHPIMRFPQNNE